MKENIVLIGMPGSGKSTLARMLSNKLRMPMIDLDTEIEAYAQKNIGELFEIGESHFRDIETEVTKKFALNKNLIISTGGGIILREENMRALQKNGIVIFLNRHVEKISNDVQIATRPLLQEGVERLQKLHSERIDLYHKYAHITIENNDNLIRALNEIIEALDAYIQKGIANEV